MKLKAGNLAKLKNLKYENYKTLAKATFTELATSGTISQFVLIKGEQVKFKAGSDPENPLLYIGDIKDWKKTITKEAWEKNTYSYGYCRVSRSKNGVTVELQVNKGALANKPADFKRIAKIFATKFKPKASLSVVPELEGASEGIEAATFLEQIEEQIEAVRALETIWDQTDIVSLRMKIAAIQEVYGKLASQRTEMNEEEEALLKVFIDLLMDKKNQVADPLAEEASRNTRNGQLLPRLGQIEKKFKSVDPAIGVGDPVKVEAAIAKLEAALEKVKQEALADGIITDQEQKKITELENALASRKQYLEQLNGQRTSMSYEKLGKIRSKLGEVEAYLNKLEASLTYTTT